MSPALKEKTRNNEQDCESVVELDIEASFSPTDAKEDDFEDIEVEEEPELDLDASQFQGKKGQAGTRTKN